MAQRGGREKVILKHPERGKKKKNKSRYILKITFCYTMLSQNVKH